LNFSGGSIGDRFVVGFPSEINIFGTEFFLDDIPLTFLALSQAFTVDDRGGAILSGTLTDGSAFAFDLNGSFDPVGIDEDVFVDGSTITVTLTAAAIPEPSSAVMLLVAGGGLLVRRRRNNQ